MIIKDNLKTRLTSSIVGEHGIMVCPKTNSYDEGKIDFSIHMGLFLDHLPQTGYHDTAFTENTIPVTGYVVEKERVHKCDPEKTYLLDLEKLEIIKLDLVKAVSARYIVLVETLDE